MMICSRHGRPNCFQCIQGMLDATTNKEDSGKRNGASDLTDVRTVQVDLNEMEMAGVAWCNERQFADLIAELRTLRAENAKLREMDNESFISGIIDELAYTICALSTERDELRAQLDEAKELAERYLAERA